MEKNDNFEAAVKQALRTVSGTYGIVAIHCDFPDRIIVARNSSPLHVGVGIDEMIVASDLSAIIGHTQQVIHLEDGEVSVLKRDDIETSDLNDVIIKKYFRYLHLAIRSEMPQATIINRPTRGTYVYLSAIPWGPITTSPITGTRVPIYHSHPTKK